jgi:hypothetical protein
MIDQTDRYLNQVCWAMGGSLAEQQAARDELRAHIEDSAREMELQGVDPEEALRAAIAALGDADAVGRSMRASRGGAALGRPLLQPAGALVLARRRETHLPRPAVTLAIAASSLVAMAVALAYLWPG